MTWVALTATIAANATTASMSILRKREAVNMVTTPQPQLNLWGTGVVEETSGCLDVKG